MEGVLTGGQFCAKGNLGKKILTAMTMQKYTALFPRTITISSQSCSPRVWEDPSISAPAN